MTRLSRALLRIARMAGRPPRAAPMALALLAAACAPGPSGPPRMTLATCAAPDWRALGVEDGARGRDMAAFAQRRAACGAGAATEADEDAWLSGHAEGVVRYCSPRNGYDLGRARAAPTLSCPPHLEAAFAQAYAEGASARAYYPFPAATPRIYPTLELGIGHGRHGGWRTGLSGGVGIGF